MRRGLDRSKSVFLGLLVSLAAVGCVAPASSTPSLGGHDLSYWRERISPAPSELAWMKIPWQPSFHEGVIEARAQGRPLLLWVMNGHPLGCT